MTTSRTAAAGVEDGRRDGPLVGGWGGGGREPMSDDEHYKFQFFPHSPSLKSITYY